MNPVRSFMMLSALMLAAPALAQKMDSKMPMTTKTTSTMSSTKMSSTRMSGVKMQTTKMGSMKTSGVKMMNSKMPGQRMAGMTMGAPTLMYTTKPGLNMMMMGHAVQFTKAPGYKLIDYTYNLHNATLSYRTTDAKGLYAFYNKALMGEGWREDMNMKMGMMRRGEYSEAYVMKNWKLDLMTTNRGSRTTVTLRTH